MYSTNKTGGRRTPRANRFAGALIACALVLGVGAVCALGLALYLDNVARTLPDIHANPDALASQRTTVVYAADGSTLAEWHGEQDRTLVDYADVPPFLRGAVVAVEDRRFYEHHGIDFEAIMRAARGSGNGDRTAQGSSTITQRVVKMLFTSGKKRTQWVKVREALTANALEVRAGKAKVLELFLNSVYLGRGFYGVESAAQHYFCKPASAMTLAESATIAGIIQAPTKYGPLDHPEAAYARRNYVLDRMAEQGYISEEQQTEAKRGPIELHPEAGPAQKAPYFLEYVKQRLIDELGAEQVYGGGLRVFTTLDPALQVVAEKAARRLSREGDPEVSLVAIHHADGHVLAMVGGRDFSVNQFNLAVQGRRQPGSAFKPFVLATALQRGVRPQTKFSAAPYSVKVKDGMWNVQNFENEVTGGHLTLSEATNHSVNAVFARLIMQVGPENVVKTAKMMGITTPLDPDPAIALGGLRVGVSPLEMASAYGTIANGGVAVPPSGVLCVLNDRGEVVYVPRQVTSRAIDRSVAAQEALMLHNVIEKGTGVKAKIGQWAAGKTGTTQSYRDAWFVGWSGEIATAVWMGHRDGQIAMTDVRGVKVTGGSFPASIWAEFMRRTGDMGSTPGAAVEQPQTGGRGQVLVRVCEDSLQLATVRCPKTIDIYLEPTRVPMKICTIH